MRAGIYRSVSVLLTVLFLLSSLLTGTLGWQSLSQNANNELREHEERFTEVRLLKLEKQPDGIETEIPVPGAAFYLFTADGTQLGGRYVTGSDGKVSVSLEPGEYYFEESAPAPGFSFDIDETGQRVTRYPFTITGDETETVIVTAYNVRLQGRLSVQKLVENADDSPLTEAQQQQEFTFTVVFSDGGTYEYAIDGGEPQEIASGGTLTLKHGQSAVFEQIPVGVLYTVAEQPVPGYTVASARHTGTIIKEGCTALFTNTYAPSQTGSLTVSKEVVDASPDGSADFDKEFTFTAEINGQTETFVLKPGESHTFPDLPVGTKYTITETDDTAEDYAATVKTYTGTITGEETLLLLFVNVYQPEAEPGNLRVTKEAVGENADPDKEFTFEVTFSDNGTYEYTVDGGEPQELVSGNVLVLKGGQTAVFANLPDGITYTVREIDAAGYLPAITEAAGTIAGGESAVVKFQNRVPDEPEQPATLTVAKQLAGEHPEADENKEFHFTLTIDGEDQTFTLKPGETKEFEIPAGASYDVREDDYFSDGYALTLENGAGAALPGQTITVTATNTYIGTVQTEIKGEKTWELGGHDAALPESVTVRLKNGDIVVEEISVTPDENGEWHYAFTAPQYDADGGEIAYTVEEAPIAGFAPSYNGFDILNTYVPPVEIDPPLIEKVVESENPPETQFSFLLRGEKDAPMPEGSDANTKIVTLTGSGEAELGEIVFEKAGIYTYTISELNTGEDGWEYDNTVYTLSVAVTLEDGALHASYTLTKNGEAADKALFVNRYASEEPDAVKIAGAKTWNHGNNPNPPDSIIVEVYADGQLAAQRLVTAKDGWQYAFEMPKYAANGHEIAYTVGEAEVPGYTAEINGYDIVNTYTGATPEPPPDSGDDEPSMPSTPSTPGGPSGPQTGDDSNLTLWFVVMLLSLVSLIVTLLLEKREARKRKYRHLR